MHLAEALACRSNAVKPDPRRLSFPRHTDVEQLTNLRVICRVGAYLYGII
jgi:hypothetical protein